MSGNIEYYKNNDGTTKYFGYVSKNGWRPSVFYPELPGRPGEVDFSKIDNKPSPCCHAPLEASGSGYGSNDKGGGAGSELSMGSLSSVWQALQWDGAQIQIRHRAGRLSKRYLRTGIAPHNRASLTRWLLLCTLSVSEGCSSHLFARE